MGDPIGWGLSAAQIAQGIKQGKQIAEIQKDIKGLRLDMQKVLEIVGSRISPNASTEEVIQATADTLANTPIDALFIAEKLTGTATLHEPKIVVKDMPPATGPFGKGTGGQ